MPHDPKRLQREIAQERTAPKVAEVIVAEAFYRQRDEIEKLREEVARMGEDTALINRWEKGQWLIGVSSIGEWQAMGQTPGLVGKGFVGKTVRDVLRQIRDLT